MGDSRPLKIAVVCEAPADRDIACDLADRVIGSEVPSLAGASLEPYRVYCGLSESQSHLLWQHVDNAARHLRIRAHGFFAGRPGAHYARKARLTLLLLTACRPKPDAVLLIVDTDGDLSRCEGLNQARHHPKPGERWSFEVVVGLEHTKRECWVLCGFDPCDPKEESLFQSVRQELGFDPRTNAASLTAKHHPQDKRNAKRVLRVLTAGIAEREQSCWRQAELKVLSARGLETGLAAYLDEVRTILAPLFKQQM